MPAPELTEVGKTCRLPGMSVNYHDIGSGAPLLFIHGSGPGVSAWANWRGVMPDLSRDHRVIALDMAGFGYTAVDPGVRFDVDTWVGQVTGLLDALGIASAHVVGNSFGGAVALHLARRHPERVERLVLMGAVSLPFALTEGLDFVWGYTPSRENMRRLIGVFAWNQALITDDLVEARYQASQRDGMDKVYESLFPGPRQRWVDALSQSEGDLARIAHRTLILHGRDDRVIPLTASIKLASVLPDADLVVYARCGHWTQIERRADFIQAVRHFVSPPA